MCVQTGHFPVAAQIDRNGDGANQLINHIFNQIHHVEGGGRGYAVGTKMKIW